MATIQERIKTRRQEKNKTLAELGEYIGVKEATVQRYESGEIKNIKHEIVVKMADFLECTPQYLMGWVDYPNENSNSSLSTSADILLTTFNSLNEAGQDKAIEYVTDLADNPKYQKVAITSGVKKHDSNIIPINIQSTEDDVYIPTIAAAHHPTGILSAADKDDIRRMNEMVGRFKQEEKNKPGQQ